MLYGLEGWALHLWTGWPLYLGLMCIALGGWLNSHLAGLLLVTVGVAVVAVAGAPSGVLAYGALGVSLAVWLWGRGREAIWTRALLTVAVAALAALQVPWESVPQITLHPGEVLCVVGDSISAGMGEHETWPRILERDHGVPVLDVSFPGSTVGTALLQARRLPPGPALVVVEIGGNDVLNRTPPDVFEQGLRTLLAEATQRRRAVIFELPAPPLWGRYAAIQRTLAQESGVALIPRRVLAGVIAGRGNTRDGLHLSPKGHRAMAATVAAVLGRAQPRG